MNIGKIITLEISLVALTLGPEVFQLESYSPKWNNTEKINMFQSGLELAATYQKLERFRENRHDALKLEQHSRVEITRLLWQKVHPNMCSFLFAVVKFETTRTKMTATATRSQRQSLVRRQQLFGRIHYLRLQHGDVIDQQHITLPPNLLNKYSRGPANNKNYNTSKNISKNMLRKERLNVRAVITKLP